MNFHCVIYLHISMAQLLMHFNFLGPIGEPLHRCDELQACDFARLEGYLPPIESSDLSTDQRYMYDLCSAVISGVYPPDLGLRKPGLINHSRWLTTGNRIMRLYVASPDASEELQILANLIVPCVRNNVVHHEEQAIV